jgi:hypothetical protein
MGRSRSRPFVKETRTQAHVSQSEGVMPIPTGRDNIGGRRFAGALDRELMRFD